MASGRSVTRKIDGRSSASQSTPPQAQRHSTPWMPDSVRSVEADAVADGPSDLDDVEATTPQDREVDTPGVEQFGVLAPRLAAQGFEPVPIIPGQKRPRPHRWRAGGFAVQATQFGSDYTGILTGYVSAIDIDVSDPTLVDEIEAVIFDVLDCYERPPPIRVGMAPRRLLVFRTEEPFSKLQTADYPLPTDPVIDGRTKRSKVEILAAGQQFVAYAIHPNTGQPYHWAGGRDLLNVRRDQLIQLDQGQAAEIIRRSGKLLADFAGAARASAPQNAIALSAHEPPLEVIDAARIMELRSALNALDANDRQVWVGNAHRLKRVSTNGRDSSAGRELWMTWSQQGAKFEPVDAMRVWNSTLPVDTGYAAVFNAAQAVGWVNPRSKTAKAEEGIKASEIEKHPLARFVDLDREVRPPRWVVPGFIAEGVVVIAGAPGVGKTTALVPLACVAAGLHEVGDPLAPKRWRHVVYIAEDTDQVLRVLAGMQRGQTPALNAGLVAERFHLVEAVRLTPERVADIGPGYRELFTRHVDGVEVPPLIVLDTKAAVIAMEDENSNAEASRVVASLKQGFAKLPVWVIGHVSKANFGRADVGALSSRGAGALDADAHQTLFLVSEEDARYLVIYKVRFEPDWRELRIEPHSMQVEALNEFGETESLTLRWSRAQPAETSRVDARQEARAVARKADAAALRQEVMERVDAAWRSGCPVNRKAVAAAVKRRQVDVYNCIEALLAERWLVEVSVPSRQRTHPNRSSFLVCLSPTEHDAVTIDKRPMPAEKLAVPASWRKSDSSVPEPENAEAIDATGEKGSGHG